MVKLKRLGKIFLLVGVGILGLLVAGIMFLILLLPSPYKIKESLKLKSKVETTQKSPENHNKPTAEKYKNDPSNDEKNDTQTALSASKNDDSQLAFESLTDLSRPLSEVCRSLNAIKYKQMGKMSSREFEVRLRDSLANNASDPILQSLKPVLQLALTQPLMKTLIAKVQQAQPTERLSLMNKMEFYSSAYDAYNEMFQNKESMESVVDQSYLTMMLGRAIEVRPELALNPHVIEYCEDIEKIMNERKATNFDEEKKAFLDFLSAATIDPKTIGFDPNYQTSLQIVFNKNGLHFHGGWIDQIFAQIATESPRE